MLNIIVNYCSNEKPFIVPLLQQCRLVLNAQVIVSIGTHMYDMTPEDSTLIAELQTQFPEVHFIWYSVDTACPLPPRNPLLQRPNAYWHNIARITGWNHARKTNDDWVLFLDADEIPDGPRLHHWVQTVLPLLPTDFAYKLGNYWYFREPIYQATILEDSPVLIHTSRLSTQVLMTDHERDGILAASHTKCIRHVVDQDKVPMIHHFSWVRSKDSLLKKIRTWGHQHDMDWTYLIEKEFAGTFSGKDFVHGYTYMTVPNVFNIVV